MYVFDVLVGIEGGSDDEAVHSFTGVERYVLIYKWNCGLMKPLRGGQHRQNRVDSDSPAVFFPSVDASPVASPPQPRLSNFFGS
jgi:hypothetical protein